MHTPLRFCVCSALVVTLTACGKKEKEAAGGPVRVAPAIFGARLMRQRCAVRGSRRTSCRNRRAGPPVPREPRRSHRGAAPAELENRDLVAASVASRGQMAGGDLRSVGAAVRADRKAQTDVSRHLARRGEGCSTTASGCSRTARWPGGDEARGARRRAPVQTAQQHLKAPQDVGGEQVKAAGAGRSGEGQCESTQAQVGIRNPEPSTASPSSHSRRRDGESAHAPDGHGHVGGRRARQHGPGAGEGRKVGNPRC